jgi:hypothetical protein
MLLGSWHLSLLQSGAVPNAVGVTTQPNKLELHMTMISAQHRNLTRQLVLPLQKPLSMVLESNPYRLSITSWVESVPPSVLDLNRSLCRAFGLSALLIFLP